MSIMKGVLYMTIHEVIDLFSHEMINEIYHSSADELSKDELVNVIGKVTGKRGMRWDLCLQKNRTMKYVKQ